MAENNTYERWLVVQAAALGHGLICDCPEIGDAAGVTFQPLTPPFPAVTCTAQAVFRTGTAPAACGVHANGRFDRLTRRVEFWNQSARLVHGERIWAGLRARGGTVGMMFWQQSLGEDVDVLLSPAPIHKHHGGMIQDCYGRPDALYPALCETVGRRFELRHYWGPMASRHSTRWIVDASIAVMEHRELAPDLLLTYLPHLDYGLQRHGPGNDAKTVPQVAEFARQLGRLVTAAKRLGRHVLIWGDYAMTDATLPVFLNRALLEEGLFKVRRVGRRGYPDLYAGRAMAMVDHQVAHIVVDQPSDLEAVAQCLQSVAGVASVEAAPPEVARGAGGDLIAVAEPGAWFDYRWWRSNREAPDYASHVDIHNKIGFDPCELFWGWPPPSVSQDPRRVGGTHGRSDVPAAVGTTLAGVTLPGDLPGLATWLRSRLDAVVPREASW